MIRSTFIDLNPVEFNYYLFMAITESCKRDSLFKNYLQKYAFQKSKR